MWNTFEGLIPWEIKIKSTLICYKQVKFEIQKYNTITIFFINIVAFRLRAKSRDPFTSGRKVSSWYFGFDIVESSSFLKRGAIIRLIPKVSSRDTFPWDGIRCRTRSAKHFEGAKTGAGNIICRELAPTFLPIPCAPSCSFHDFSILACQTETLLRFSAIQNNSTKPAPSYFQFRDFTRSLLRYRFPKRFLARSHPVGLLRVFIRQTKRMNSRYLEQRVG